MNDNDDPIERADERERFASWVAEIALWNGVLLFGAAIIVLIRWVTG